MMTSRIGLPGELKVAGAGEEFESILYWEKDDGDLYLCTYTTKSKSKGKKNILVLSAMRPLLGITHNDGKFKPAIIKLYDFTNGDNDKFLLQIEYYPMQLYHS